LREPDYRPIYVAGLVNSPSLWFYFSALFVAWLGAVPEAVRSAASIGGIFYPVAIYALARQLFGTRVAVPAATIAAVLLWNVNFSRNGWSYAWTVTLDALSMALLVRAVQVRRPGTALAAGLLWGLALHGYNPARLMLPIVAAFLGLSFLRAPRQFMRQQRAMLVLYALGAALVASPLVLFAIRHPDEYLSRSHQVFIMHEVRSAKSWEPLVSSVQKHLLMFNVAGDRNGRHNLPGAPMLDQVTAALFVIGLALAATRLRRPEWALLPIWCVVGLAGGALTLAFEAPQALRGIEAMTPAILLAAAPLGLLVTLSARRPATGRAWISGLTGLLLVAVVGLNYHAYFVRKANDFASWAEYSGPESIVAQQVRQLADTHTVYLDDTWLDHPTIHFLAPDLKEHERFDPVGNIPLRDVGPVAVFTSGELTSVIEDLERMYPDATVERTTSPVGGPVVVHSIVIPPDAIEAAHGVDLRVSAAGSSGSALEVIDSLDIEWGGEARPFERAELGLSTVVAAPRFGRYRLVVQGPPGATLDVNGQEVASAGAPADVQLARGNHRVRLTGTFEAPGRLRLLWTIPGESEPRPIPPANLFRTEQAARGLLATYRRGTDFDAPIQFSQVDRHLQRRIHLLPLPRPYTVEWIGTLHAPKSGVYSFWIDAIGRSWVWIDDKRVFADVHNSTPEAMVHLGEGDHAIRIRYLDSDQFSRFDLAWRPPDGERESIPTARLMPPGGVLGTPPPPTVPATAALPPLGEVTTRWLYTAEGEVRGVGVGPDGAVFAVDTQRGAVQRLGELGRPTLEMTDGLAGEPVDVDVGPDGRPVVLDAEHGHLVRYEADGSRPTQIGGPALRLYRPRGLGIGPDGAIYVADTGGNQVVKLAPDGTLLERFGPGTGGPEELRQPTDVAVGPDGDLYVANAEPNAIVRLDSTGRYRTHWAIGAADTLRGPHVAVGPEGGIYVSEPSRGRVARFGSDGQPAGVIESVHQGRLPRTPVGVAVGPDGTVYIADPGLKGVVAIAIGDQPPASLTR
ncbi:MAG: PA14 domain-containing protein, partial [Chloroflexota bacterium]|nr:PA14 domain-containing protein [Chloroflexota bacterium]